jgi:uncharacterized protein YjbJ (UPF0337 family)
MNWDQVEGQWKQMRGLVQSKWAKLTDDDVQNLRAKKDQLVGKIQQRYGVLKDEAEQQVDQWIAELKLHEGHESSGAAGVSPETGANRRQ